MAMSRSCINSSDEVCDQASDFCCICANNDRIQPASYFCFECGVFGRYLCGTCLRSHNLFVGKHDVAHIGSQSNSSFKQKCKEYDELHQKYEDERDQCTKYKRLYTEKQEEKEHALHSFKQKCKEHDELHQKYEDERDQCTKYKRLYTEEQEEKEHALHRLQQKCKAYDQLHQKYQDERDQHTKYQRLYTVEQAGKEDALRRLQAIANSELRDNNPNIADLSDLNRPTKIAEKMSELYDNQWTDAYSVLEDKGLGEKQIIKSLLDMFMSAYSECNKLASENFFERVQRCIEIPTEEKQPTTYTVVMPNQLKQQVQEFRKRRARFVVKKIETIVLKRIQIEHQKAVSEYLSHCIEIGWFCAVQDPPLVVRIDAPVKFDTNTYKDYTRRGKYTEFVAWPALYLHDGGALLSKGVAQGTDTPALSNELSTASGRVSSAGYKLKIPHFTKSATASKAQCVTESQVLTASESWRANVIKDNMSPRPMQQQHYYRTVSLRPGVRMPHDTKL